MEIRMLREEELMHAAGLSRFVFDSCLRNRMEFVQTIPFIENYIREENLKMMCREDKLIIWGAFEFEQLVGVGAMQTDGMITMLYVLPQYMGRNCGMYLLTRMKEYAKEVLHLNKVFVNATPAWTAVYFQKKGFSFMQQNPNLHVPFVGMQAFLEHMQFQNKEKISGKTIVLAVLACVGFATVVGSWFMSCYLF